MSVRVLGTIGGVSLIGVSWVGASEGVGCPSCECTDGVLVLLFEGERGGVELGRMGGVSGALNRRGRSPSTWCIVPRPPPHPAEVRVGGSSGVEGAER